MSKINRTVVLGAEFDVVTFDQTMSIVDKMLASGRRGMICTVNVAILMMMRQDALLKDIVSNSVLTVADGQPIVWISGLFGTRLPERVTGVDLVEGFARLAAANSYSIYLLGASDEVVEKVEHQLASGFPGLRIAGRSSGYFPLDLGGDIAGRIRESAADILIVAMGVPRQEQFLHRYFEQSGAIVALPVGGSFDVIAGSKKRAPEWMQKFGLEWLFRLAQEPRRLWKRYLVTNIQFLTLGTIELLRGKLKK